MVRLFIALWPDSGVRAELAAWRDRRTWPRKANPVRSERLHATVHFIGEVPEARIPELIAALRVPFTPFTLDFGHCALWPHGIAVLEPLAPPATLSNLHAALGQVLERHGLPVDGRPYQPHVTMARRAAGRNLPASGPAIRWPVGHYALMASSGGYATLQRYDKWLNCADG
ncbi:MAG: RNA 2',3'-cyclic phosphodiesterase [Pseudomonadota bacterium]